ncbi:hypothetical protein BDQ17DRAFT_1410126 [Cyathus striatus]|nr:hypothetical protein BDQ17DRAFT_1410126 [Cyathus striatus]
MQFRLLQKHLLRPLRISFGLVGILETDGTGDGFDGQGGTSLLEKFLIVTQPKTPGMLAPPQTVKEGKDIQKKLQSSGLVVEYLEGMKATIDKVVESMEGRWESRAVDAHPQETTKGCFAFLSACETGTGDESLPEEAVHLAAGVLQAGYRSVIATMWAIDDSYAAMVSKNLSESDRWTDDHNILIRKLYKGLGLILEKPTNPSHTDVNLANHHQQKYLATKDPHDVVQSTDPNRPITMINLAGSLIDRFREEALGINLQLLEDILEDHPLFRDILCNVGNSYLWKFGYTKALEDIDEAISFLNRGFNHTPEGDAIKPRRITDLGNLYLERAKITKSPEDTDKAIESFRRALNLTPECHPEGDLRMRQLIIALRDRFELLDDAKEIDEAILLQSQRAVAADSKDARSVELRQLSALFARRFSKSSKKSDMENAIAAQQDALELTPSTDSAYAVMVEQLMSLMYNLAVHTKNLEDVGAALEFGKQSLILVSETEKTRISGAARMCTLSFLRFQSSTDPDDIDQAISNQREVLRLSNDLDHRKYFGGLLLSRYQLKRTVEDLKEAIAVLQRSFGMTSSNVSELIENLQTTAESYYMDEYNHTGNTYCFQNAMTLLKEARKRSPLDHKLLPSILESIGNVLLRRFDNTGDEGQQENSGHAQNRA